eukprot:CFRG4997T1
MKSAVVILSFCATSIVHGHGFLRVPRARGGTSDAPSRSICGLGGSSPLTNRATYTEGQVIEVQWDITIPHDGGTVQMRICSSKSISQACFDDNLLQTIGGEDTVADVNGERIFTVEYQLPSGLTCPNGCVMQWFWNTPKNGEYHGCTDIIINSVDLPTRTPTPTRTRMPTRIPSPIRTWTPTSTPTPAHTQTPTRTHVNTSKTTSPTHTRTPSHTPTRTLNRMPCTFPSLTPLMRPPTRNNAYELFCGDRVQSRSCTKRKKYLKANKRCCRYTNLCPEYATQKCSSSFCCE